MFAPPAHSGRHSRILPLQAYRHQLSLLAVVVIIDNRAVLQSRDSFGDEGRGQQKPFAGPNFLTKAIGNFDVETCGGEKLVQEVLQLYAVDII